MEEEDDQTTTEDQHLSVEDQLHETKNVETVESTLDAA